MGNEIKKIYKGGKGELIEKKSRFIGHVCKVDTEAEALAFIHRIKKEHWNASHNCFAYIIGTQNQIQRCSDDGEPSGTAGRPILDVLSGGGIHNAAIVVTRYFGGTLLGTGGLIRAYQLAAKAGLDASVMILMNPGCKVLVQTDYNGNSKLQYIFKQMGLIQMETRYTDIIKIELIVPEYLYDIFISKVTEATNGRTNPIKIADVYYGEVEGKQLAEERV